MNILNTSWVHSSLNDKRNTYLSILYCQISLLFWYCLAWQLRLSKTIFFFRNRKKRDSILFYLEVNSTGYSKIEEPIRLRKKTLFTCARPMLKQNIRWDNLAHINSSLTTLISCKKFSWLPSSWGILCISHLTLSFTLGKIHLWLSLQWNNKQKKLRYLPVCFKHHMVPGF